MLAFGSRFFFLLSLLSLRIEAEVILLVVLSLVCSIPCTFCIKLNLSCSMVTNLFLCIFILADIKDITCNMKARMNE